MLRLQETIVATRVKPTAKDLYDADPYAWAHDQAALLRADGSMRSTSST